MRIIFWDIKTTPADITYSKTIEIPEAFIRLREDGIAHVTFKDGITIDIPLQLRLIEAYNQVCDNKKTPFLFDAKDHVSITKEAKNNAITIEGLSPVCASAIIANNLAYKLIAEFYIKLNKPKSPFKIFRNHDDAFEWLKQFRK